jgi:hypothetical protein
MRAQAALPPLRDKPLTIEPLYDDEAVISDEQLLRVLAKLVPRDQGRHTKINHVDHALRFWGIGAHFKQEGTLSGDQMRQLLIDHRRFTQVYGDEPPLLIDSPRGVRVRTQEGMASSSHVDHTMASLAEVGTELESPVWTPSGETTFRSMVEHSLRDFSLNQAEYEWSVLTYALFLPQHGTRTTWTTREGQQVDFDRMAARMMRQRMPQGVCFGNHRLYGLVVLLRVDDRLPMTLSDRRRAEVVEYLRDMTERLVRNQHPDGFWNKDWPHLKATSSQPSDQLGDRLLDRILATGHALEWWAMAPAEVQPPQHVLTAASQWLVKTVDNLPEERITEYYPFLSHVGRALALWRKRWPEDIAGTLAQPPDLGG